MDSASVLRRLAAFVLLVTNSTGSAWAVESQELSQLTWRYIGPTIPSGRMTSVAGTDTDASLYLAGSAGGGAFITRNAGVTWTPVFERASVAAVGAVAIAPSDTNTMWIGTGEANPRNDVSYGDGVYESSDGGSTWVHRGLDETAQISRILIDPRNRSTVLVGALGNVFKDSSARGVFRTTDGGRTWRRTLYVSNRAGVSDMIFDPTDSRTVYAGVWEFRRTPWGFSNGGGRGGLYVSHDGGQTWSHLVGSGLPTSPIGRIGLGISAENHRRIYALIHSNAGRLWRSDDAGATWKRQYSNAIINDRPWYFSHIAIDPRNSLRALSLSSQLLESSDGGRSFAIVNQTVHADHHDFWWSSDGRRAIEANDGGIALSEDYARTWSWSQALPTAQIYHVGFDHSIPYRVCVALQDTHSYCGPSNSLDPVGITNQDWISTNTSDGMWIWPDREDPNLIWDGYNDGELGLFDRRTEQRQNISPDPQEFVEFFGAAQFRYRFNWLSPIALDPFDAKSAYYGGNVVFKTSDRGQHWLPISPDLTKNDKRRQAVSGGPISLESTGAEVFNTILDIEPSTLHEGTLWVGTDDGGIAVTEDGGAHWRDASIAGVPPDGRIETVSPSQDSAAEAYAVVDRRNSGDRKPYVFRTEDTGRTWMPIVTGLDTATFARTVRPDPNNPNVVYLGTEQGIRVSLDRGAHWQSLQLNLPTSAVHDIRIQPESNDLLAGTHGRGLWVLEDVTAIQVLKSARAAGIYFFKPRTAYDFWFWNRHYSWTYDVTPSAPRNILAAENPKAGVALTYYLNRSLRVPPSLVISNQNGTIVRTLRGTSAQNKPGINRTQWTLCEEPPVPYLAAPAWNNFSDGATVPPGEYTATLRAGEQQIARTFDVRPDPRAQWTFAQYEGAHDFSKRIYDAISEIDTTLNAIDTIDTRRKSRQTAPYGKSDRLEAIKHDLSLNPTDILNVMPERQGLRERFESLLFDVIGNSQGPALEPDVSILETYERELREEMSAYDDVAKNLRRPRRL